MAEKMKAVRKIRREPGLDLVEVDIPQIKSDEVLVKVASTAICGSDMHFYHWDAFAQSKIKPPLTIGHEFSGEIVEVGKSVKDYKLGDYVAADSHISCGVCPVCKLGLQHICQNLKIFGNEVDGSFAQYVAVPENSLWKLDRSIDPDIGAVLEPLGGAVQATLIEPVTAKSVVIFGDGPIALFAAGVARVSGASHITLVGMVPSRLEVARKMGANTVYNVTEEPDVVARLLENSDGLGADVVIDMSGSAVAMKNAFASVRKGGRVTLFGLTPKPVEEFDFNFNVILRQVTVHGVAGRHMWDTWVVMDGLLKTGRLDPRPVITDVLPLEKFDEGFMKLSSGSRDGIKIILRPWE
jgi:threonine 3-dehydrogenase